MPRILIADDHSVVRQGLIQILRDELPGAFFAEASTGKETIERVREEEWDILVLDISFRDKTGFDVLREARVIAPRLPVLILSMYTEEQYAVRSLRSGAAGYVTKGTAPREIAAAVILVLEGKRYITPAVAEKLADDLRLDSQKLPHERLSDREYEVFRRLAVSKTVKEIAAELSLSVQTISTYRTRLLTKMGMRSNSQLTDYALRNRLFE